MCVLVICFSTCDSSRGVCRFGNMFVWLCVHSIETSDSLHTGNICGHYGVGLYCMVCGGVVVSVFISSFVVS